MTVTRTPPPAARTQAFRKKYKAQGVIAAVLLMWLDFGLIYHGLSTSDPVAMGAGMVVMIAAVAIGFVFG